MSRTTKHGPPPAAAERPTAIDGVSGLAHQRAIFSVLCAACLGLSAGYAWLSRSEAAGLERDTALPAISSLDQARELSSTTSATPPHVATSGGPAANATTADAPVLLFRHTGLDRSYGLLAVDRAGYAGSDRRAAALRCDRVHFAGARGVCLAADRGVLTTYSAIVFDESFKATHVLPLAGLPSRVKVSPDGRLAGMTVFVSGHSYTQSGFSTETSIIDTATGAPVIRNFEDLEVERDGRVVQAADFNFWGVTFAADGDRFYSTLGTGGQVFLVEGSIARRRVRVVRQGIECPSISPDNTRVAYKKPVRTDGRLTWRLAVLDLTTLEETVLAETRHVDDQVEWLDDDSILYALPDEDGPSPAVTEVWSVPADGSGQPVMVLQQAYSPTVLRP